MKSVLVLFSFFVLTSALAFDSSTPSSTPLMIVRKNSGFVPRDRAYSFECTIHTDKVFTKLRQSGVEDVNVKDTHYTRDVFSPEIAIEMLEEASRGAIEERHGPTGGPTSSFIGVLSGETTERQVKLLVTGSTTRRNTAKTVEALVEFGQRNCSF